MRSHDVTDVRCPDCGSPWHSGQIDCTSCGLSGEDVKAAAAFYKRLLLEVKK